MPEITRSTPPDHLTKTGARKLALNIERYWASRGHIVKAWPLPFEADGREFYAVKSDLLNGLPRSVVEIVPQAAE